MNSLLLILGLLAVGSATNYGVEDRVPSRLPFKTVVKQKESHPVATSSEAELPEVVPSALDVSEQAQITLPAMPIMQPAAVPVGPPPAQDVPAEVPVVMPPAEEAVAVSAEVIAESELPVVLEPAPVPAPELKVSEQNQKKGHKTKHHWKKLHQKVPKKAPHHSLPEIPTQLPSEPTVAPTVPPPLEGTTVPVSREPAEEEVAMEAPTVPPVDPTTVPTTTIKYELNEKAAEAYWKTFVPPVVTTVLPPVEGIPLVGSGAAPTQDVPVKAPLAPTYENSAEQLPTNAEPAEEIPTMSPATVKSKLATLQAIPVTPEYVPLEPGPVVLDVPVTTVPPSTTTVRYVLNPEAAEKYWATAKFPAPTKAPVPVPPVVQPAQNVPAISEPTSAPPAGPNQAPQNVPAVPETPLVLLPPLVQPAQEVPAIVEVPLVAVPPIVQPIHNVPAVPEPVVVSLPVLAPAEETTVVESKPKMPQKPKHHEEKHRKKPKAAKATQLPSQDQPTVPTPVKPIGY